MKSRIAFLAVTVVLFASFAANAYLYNEHATFALENDLQKKATIDLKAQVADLQSQVSNLNDEIRKLQNEKSVLISEKAELQSQIETLINQTRFLQSENSNLTTSIDELRINLLYKPNLVTRLGVTDVKRDPDATYKFYPRLFVQGDVFNTGGVTARNARLHITLFIGEQVVKEAYIELGTMESLSAVHVEQNIQYESSGSRLTRWTIIPEASS